MGPVRELLRHATNEEHRALEADVDAVGRFSREPERSRLAAGYRRLEEATHAALLPFSASLVATGLPMPPETDRMVAMNDDVAVAPSSTNEALGYLYVVCGSTLGGTVILRTLSEQGLDTSGLGFLVDGAYTAPALWRSLLAALERDLTTDAERAAAVAGARKAFASARTHLGRA